MYRSLHCHSDAADDVPAAAAAAAATAYDNQLLRCRRSELALTLSVRTPSASICGQQVEVVQQAVQHVDNMTCRFVEIGFRFRCG